MSLLISFLSFLTTIWGNGIVFSWLINLTGISALLVWCSIGFVSLRFRYTWSHQNRPLTDLPYTQPFYPLLPISIIILATLMFIAEGYSTVVQEPFEVRNVVGTYIGVGVYVVLYGGYAVWERVWCGGREHFVPVGKVDLDTDAVWARGEGTRIREMEREEREKGSGMGRYGAWRWFKTAVKEL